MISIKSDSCKAERKGFSATAKSMLIYGIISILLHGLVLSAPVLAGTETGEFCPTCPDWSDMDGWLAKKAAYDQEQQDVKLQVQQIVPETQNADPAPIQNTIVPMHPIQSNYSPARTGRFAEALASPAEVAPNDIVLDISPGATRFIEGAVNVNYEEFMGEGGRLKSVSEMATLLGDAGISRNDSLVIAGECLPCGGGPSPAIFSYWVLKYLGQEKVRVLDGSIDDWAAAGLNTSNKSATRPRTNYTPLLMPELLATFDYVVNGGAQIVDARSASRLRHGLYSRSRKHSLRECGRGGEDKAGRGSAEGFHGSGEGPACGGLYQCRRRGFAGLVCFEPLRLRCQTILLARLD